MRFLVDANVLCEPTRKKPHPEVVDWLRRNEPLLCVDPIILGEIHFGILSLPDGKRRKRLQRWFEKGVRLVSRIDWTPEIGLTWGKLLASLRAEGRSMPLKDSQIAATALHEQLTLATRNVADFAGAGVRLVNPFEAGELSDRDRRDLK